MKTSINSRLEALIARLHGGNKRAFATAIGVSPTVIENVVGSRQGKPSYDVIEKICANADVAPEWLLTGNGPMLRSEESKAPEPTVVYERDPRDIEMIADKNKIIQRDEELIATLRHRIGELEKRGFRTGAIHGVQPADIPIISPETTPRRK